MHFGAWSEPWNVTPPPTKTTFTFPRQHQYTSPFVEDTDIDDFGTFDELWTLKHLRQLNSVGEPRLTESQLLEVCNDVLVQVKHLLGLPVVQAFEEASTIFRVAVISAKYPAGLPQTGVNMATPLLGQFLVAINGFIQVRNEQSLADYVVLEPPKGGFSGHYAGMIQELNQAYPKGNEEALEEKCTQQLKAAVEGADGSPWTSFIKFMVQYLAFLRDVSDDPSRYLETYELLSELQQRENSTLGHSSLGHLMLPIVVANARLVCKLAIGLDKHPELIAHLRSGQAGGEDGGPRETLPERAANILRQAFVTCLNDRMSGLSADGRPEGKKRGIYIIANLCLKILFQCRKTRNATQIFENIYNLSPPLSAYPKRERVTYLYYLGRFLFQNSHFYRAQMALQYAYEESPARPDCVRQRRHILVYLIASNIILGRFPSDALLNLPEAQGFRERFLPLCLAIRQGNIAAFRQHLAFTSPHADWFLHFRVLLQLRNRCEPLVWRSLVRKLWIINGTRPSVESRVAPTVDLHDLAVLFTEVERRTSPPASSGYTDPDFEGVDYGDGDEDNEADTLAMESKVSSLVDQGLLNGFVSHARLKFAIRGQGATGGNILAAGFPQAWNVLSGKAKLDGEVVPGWKREQPARGGGGSTPAPRGGMVINLSGLKPIGVA